MAIPRMRVSGNDCTLSFTQFKAWSALELMSCSCPLVKIKNRNRYYALLLLPQACHKTEDSLPFADFKTRALLPPLPPFASLARPQYQKNNLSPIMEGIEADQREKLRALATKRNDSLDYE
ncbi:uncharacterized protein G2W53_038565 [Senna tora]|uniref:Uncharacterized protein n=1 Tax=Senna tora TaxID=362788 RepID=A0A834W704_9FABA|nr:uncharacterized protein G2W53_038565 [Senna tora]